MKLAVLLSAIVLTGCQTLCVATVERNDCVVDAMEHKLAVASDKRFGDAVEESEILGVMFFESDLGHASHVWQHDGNVWVYEPKQGSRNLGSIPFDAFTVAIKLYGPAHVRKAVWL